MAGTKSNKAFLSSDAGGNDDGEVENVVEGKDVEAPLNHENEANASYGVQYMSTVALE